MDIIKRPLIKERLTLYEEDFFATIRKIIRMHGLYDFKIYVAGGWVRDHLLNLRSHDLDMIVDGRLIKALVKKLEKPDAFKYLEFKSKKAVDLSSGFCKNHKLYKLFYKNDNFQVDMREMKSPYQLVDDYYSRDFTVNAMYMNVHTMEIEMTRDSFNDLEANIIRCVLSPKQTFMDPTRYMRLVRFAGNKGFKIDASLSKYIKKQDMTGLVLKLDANSKKAMQREISVMFERIGASASLEHFINLNMHHYFDLSAADDVNMVGWRSKLLCRFRNGIEIVKVMERLFKLPKFKDLIDKHYQSNRRYVYRIIKSVCFGMEFYLDNDSENFVLLLESLEIEKENAEKTAKKIDYLRKLSKFEGNINKIARIAQNRAETDPFYFVALTYVVKFFLNKGKNEEYIVHTVVQLYIEPLLALPKE